MECLYNWTQYQSVINLELGIFLITETDNKI